MSDLPPSQRKAGPASKDQARREAGDHFLAWFDYNRERANASLEKFLPKLKSAFSRAGCGYDSADLVQNVVDRVTAMFSHSYVSHQPEPFLFGVANNIRKEYW